MNSGFFYLSGFKSDAVSLMVSAEAKAFWINAVVMVVAGVERKWEWVVQKLREHFGMKGSMDIICEDAGERMRMVDRGDIIVEGS